MHSVDFGQLPNGLRVVTIQRPHLHRAVLATYIEVGSRHETARTNGLSHFLEHMLFRGTERHPSAFALNDAIERLGGTLAAATHGDYTRFDLAVPPVALTAACRTLGDVFTVPVFAQIETEKAIVREEILEDLDDELRDVNADNLLRRELFASHPLGFPITGTLANVERFAARDLDRHLARHYRGGTMVVAVCSPLSHRQALRAVERGFGGIAPGGALPPRSAHIAQRRARFVHRETSGSQTTVRIGFPTPGSAASSARAIDVLIRVLDDGMSTRLHRRVCDELGLAYEVSAGAELFRDVGIMDVAASVAPATVPRLVNEVLAMLADLAVDGPTHDELAKAKHRYDFDLAGIGDDSHGLADFYGAAALWGTPATVDDRRREVQALRVEDLRRAARMVFVPARLNLATVGSVDARARRAIRAAVQTFRSAVARPRSPGADRAVFRPRATRIAAGG